MRNILNRKSVYLSYSESTQVLGYGAIGGDHKFRSIQKYIEFKRSVSKNLELGYTTKEDRMEIKYQYILQWDDDLVDWTYD